MAYPLLGLLDPRQELAPLDQVLVGLSIYCVWQICEKVGLECGS